MKKGILYLMTTLLMMSLCIISCGNEDSESSDSNELYGAWYLRGFLQSSDESNRDVAGSRFYFEKDGSLQVHFSKDEGGRVYPVTLMPGSGNYHYVCNKEAGILYMESNGAGKEMVSYHYRIEEGRLYIVSPFDYNEKEKLVWYFER